MAHPHPHTHTHTHTQVYFKPQKKHERKLLGIMHAKDVLAIDAMYVAKDVLFKTRSLMPSTKYVLSTHIHTEPTVIIIKRLFVKIF